MREIRLPGSEGGGDWRPSLLLSKVMQEGLLEQIAIILIAAFVELLQES